MEHQEQLLRTVKLFGNGAHIFVPREWAGEQIQVIKLQKKKLKERILEVLDPYLESIVGIYLYGSYARGEQEEESDIDLFIITDKKIKIKAEGFEIISLEENMIEKALKSEPVLMYSLFLEAKPIINAQLLEHLRIKAHPRLSDFSEFLNDCKRLIQINKKSLESEKGEYYSGEAVMYSLILRLRGVYLIRLLLRAKKYNTSDFKEWISEKLPHIDFKRIYEAYRSAKREIKIKQKIKVKDLSLLLNLLSAEVKVLANG